MSNKTKYYIIGCGVIGLTTGICLNLSGYSTIIVTKDIPNYNNYKNKSNSRLATEYAAASIKPSTIDYKNQKQYINKLLSDSIDVFDMFLDKKCVNYTKHYLGGNEHERPLYSDVVRNYKEGINNTPGDVNESAVFDCQFIDMPDYIKLLINMYKKTGGKIIERKVDNLKEFDNCINCSGLGSKEIINDTNMKSLKGHLSYVETGKRVIREQSKHIESYAYTIDGESTYCYMQKDRIILGGTVIESEDENNFVYYKTDTEKVPEHIIYNNRKILDNYFDLDILNYDIYGFSGYRPYREGGVRIEKDSNGNIHNYGHGGCGVTLSWGSALEVCEILGIDKNDARLNIRDYLR